MWKRNAWYLGIIFIFLIIFNINFMSGKEVSVDYVDEVNFEQEFDFSIELIDFNSGAYDVKIDINEKSRIAQIWNGEKWQSTFNYVLNAIESEENRVILKMKIIENVNGDFPVVIRIRENGKTTIEKFEGFLITVSGSNEGVGGSEEEQDSGSNEGVGWEENENKIRLEREINDDGENNEKEVIYLSSPEAKSINSDKNDKVLFRSTNDKIKYYAIYGFAIFCIVLIILLLMDKKNG